MPTLNKQFTLEVTPEQFIRACSNQELYELHLLMCSPAVEHRINTVIEKLSLNDGK
ncbi:hypothetical protein ACLI1A_10265 [Flavobacterium sp. RHBU_3]|uniref:hypothetical protein n=1 Tax=Flavobacterium sp. RHBU_3 TaxID=3391184 RepID=UPI00398523EA